MENKDLEFDIYSEYNPLYSEYNPLSKEIKDEIQKLFKPERHEDTGFCASIIRKLMPCKLA